MQDGFLVVDSTVCVDDLDAEARNGILYENKDVVLAWLRHYAICRFLVLSSSFP